MSDCRKRATCGASSPQSIIAIRATGTDWLNEAKSMTKLRTGHMSRMTDKSVRQCARRCVPHIVVAQASPLFSDHAPREVHLWQ